MSIIAQFFYGGGRGVLLTHNALTFGGAPFGIFALGALVFGRSPQLPCAPFILLPVLNSRVQENYKTLNKVTGADHDEHPEARITPCDECAWDSNTKYVCLIHAQYSCW